MLVCRTYEHGCLMRILTFLELRKRIVTPGPIISVHLWTTPPAALVYMSHTTLNTRSLDKTVSDLQPNDKRRKGHTVKHFDTPIYRTYRTYREHCISVFAKDYHLKFRLLKLKATLTISNFSQITKYCVFIFVKSRYI